MLQGKVALITGATGALGTAVVDAFLQGNAKVAAVSRSAERSEVLADRTNLLPLTADMLDPAAVDAAVAQVRARFGRLDILVHLVGGWYGAPVEATPVDSWREQLDLNLTSTFLAAHAVLPGMLAQGSGVLLAVGSRPALEAAAGNAAYAVAKLGVIKLMQTIGEEHRKRGIRANVVVPSIIDTPANRRSMPKADFSTWVKPVEIASVLCILASDHARVVSGAVVPVYGRT